MNRVLLIFLALFCTQAWATTRTADSASIADIQAKLDLSIAGDIVIIPADTKTWTTMPYTGGYGIGIPAGVHLQGSGVGLTIITDECGTSCNGAILIRPGTGTEISNFTITQADADYSDNCIKGQDGVLNLKIHDMAISNVSSRGLNVIGNNGPHPTGVCWNTTFTAKNQASPGDGVFQLVNVQGSDFLSYSNPPTQSTQVGSWAYDPGMGTANAFFLENCTFNQNATGDSTIETYYGGKVVVRYSTGTNIRVGVHGRDSSVRSGHTVEFYNNTVTANIGSAYVGPVVSRGGTGVVWGNTITQTGGFTTGNAIHLQQFRNRVSTFGAEYSGSHTGSNGASVMTDSAATWGGINFGLTVPGGNDAGQYKYIFNTTTGASANITANTPTTVTGTLLSGSRQDWNTGDTYIIITRKFNYFGGQLDGHSRFDGNTAVFSGTHTGSNGATDLTDSVQAWGANQLDGYGDYTVTNVLRSYAIWNMTSGAYGYITANTADTASMVLRFGSRQTWSTGDSYIITYGYPGLDQNGWSGPTTFAASGFSTQTLNPWYSWDNTFNGSPDQLDFVLDYMGSNYTDVGQPDSSIFVQENREFYNATPKPGYTPYTYPHPLRELGPAASFRQAPSVGVGF